MTREPESLLTWNIYFGRSWQIDLQLFNATNDVIEIKIFNVGYNCNLPDYV